ncbi:MAG TPA: DinB family protein, partial [Anseongella sp.]|nr:DinB family protein [Anseongella sp.]
RPEAGSKAYLIDYFNQATEKLRGSVAGLSEEQLRFKPAEDRWSINQCLEHIVATEKMLFDMARTELEKPARPERRSEVKYTDQQLIAGVTDRSEKYKTSEALQPQGKYGSAEEAIKDLETVRAAVLDFIRRADIEDLRNHVVEHPAGTSDGYQNLLFIAGHSVRHTQQIEEVKSDPGFPKSQ